MHNSIKEYFLKKMSQEYEMESSGIKYTLKDRNHYFMWSGPNTAGNVGVRGTRVWFRSSVAKIVDFENSLWERNDQSKSVQQNIDEDAYMDDSSNVRSESLEKLIVNLQGKDYKDEKNYMTFDECSFNDLCKKYPEIFKEDNYYWLEDAGFDFNLVYSWLFEPCCPLFILIDMKKAIDELKLVLSIAETNQIKFHWV